ncbi:MULTISPECIES: DUF2938 domain-containing protein [Pseudomonas]|uniref:DUF2938 domain-containing protein n=1 Tax=Pseudomonas entomophila TaxID=312306 RepID=A0A3S8UNG9_9PSED|nr:MULTISPECIES: DUF2938 domain-containing protein [Pseudomonas]AZL69812.1 DUF2938 domain-containing protein [Pseudomonas oryziphila]MDZ4020956.1 hypothetical protein [Pseudomonas sichuanensis]UVL87869.1 DUF2938 domain-containing protein [Pseudomonas sichuanensis]
MTVSSLISSVLFIGIGATLVMDLWTLLLRRLGVTTLNYAMVGRWAGHLLEGRWRHAAIGKAAPVRGELAWGWVLHYATGLLFAGLLIALAGEAWLGQPSLLPALSFGVVSVLVPLCVIQPALGAGYFAANTPAPLKSCLRSLATHCVFGSGLYLAALGVLWLVG